MARRAVVTGGAGFLGSHLCDALLARDYGVVCVDNFSTGDPDNVAHLLADPRFRLVVGDVTDGLEVGGPVDLVLHFASPASPPDYLRLPVETLLAGSVGTLNTLDFAAARGARYILASTSEVYGDPDVHPQTEDYWGNVNPVGPRSVYDEAKRFSEAAVTAYRARGVDGGIVRLFNTYGPRMRTDDGRAIPTFIGQALDGLPLTVAGNGSQTRSLCYVDDTIRGVLAMAASAEAGPINIGNPDEVTILALARWIAALAGADVPVEFVDLPTDDPRRRCPDITRAAALLGWRPHVAAEAGLPRTLAWFAARRHGWPAGRRHGHW